MGLTSALAGSVGANGASGDTDGEAKLVAVLRRLAAELGRFSAADDYYISGFAEPLYRVAVQAISPYNGEIRAKVAGRLEPLEAVLGVPSLIKVTTCNAAGGYVRLHICAPLFRGKRQPWRSAWCVREVQPLLGDMVSLIDRVVLVAPVRRRDG